MQTDKLWDSRSFTCFAFRFYKAPPPLSAEKTAQLGEAQPLSQAPN